MDKLKTNFFANVSHEFRTPLTLIYGPVERLLKSTELPTGVKQDLGVIRRNTALLHKYVSDLLDVAKLEAGRMEMTWSRINLAELVRATAGVFSSSSMLRNIKLEIDAPASLMVDADSRKMERVLINLITNAIKFSPAGATVRLSLSTSEGMARFAVEDAGPGVPPEEREAIFERFYQSGTDSPTRAQGIGLGLSIVQEFVHLHQGTIHVSANERGGASFIVELPLVKAIPPDPVETIPATRSPESDHSEARSNLIEASAAWAERTASGTSPSTRESAPALFNGRSRILVVEDNPDLRIFIKRCLEDDSEILEASDGEEALTIARRQPPPDLIVSDMLMAGMNGQQMVMRLKEEPALADIPIIILSARADDESKMALFALGVQDYIVKPFVLEELRARIQTQLASKNAKDTLRRELASQSNDLQHLAEQMTERARELAQAKEAAESANRTKDRFLAVLSHELRTPLTPVMSAAEMLRSPTSLAHDELVRISDLIRRNIKVEARLIDDLLDLTRISRGKLQLRLQALDVHEAIEEAIQFCEQEAKEKNVRLGLQLMAEDCGIQGDPSRLLQVFWNLLANAIKFSNTDSSVVVRTRNPSAGHLTVEFADQGIGMTEDEMARVFDPFSQTEQALASQKGGLGLGLAIAKGLVNAHGGTLSAKSQGKGAGSVFTIEFQTSETKRRAPETVQGTPDAVPDNCSVRLLLVEDHEDTRRSLQSLLQMRGYHVLSAGCLEEAKKLAATHLVDILISDLNLPDGSGLDLMRSLHGKNIKAVAITGFGSEEDIRSTQEAGFHEHITKPVAFDHLMAVLHKLAKG